MEPFILRAALAGIGLAIAAAPLGCFVIWRRMAYFGDATGHAAILGVALALSTGVSAFAGVFAAALAMALLLTHLSDRFTGADALLGVFAHGALAFGLVWISLTGSSTMSLESYLFGEILFVSTTDVQLIWMCAAVVSGLMAWRWQRLLTATVSPDLAVASGLRPKMETLAITVGVAFTVAAALKVVGALLIAALLVIPAAAARPLARNPETMVLATAVLGIVSVIGGIALSFAMNTPTGPSIVAVSAVIFGLTHSFARAQ